MIGKQILWAASALTENGWRRSVRVEIGSDGRIGAVADGVEPDGIRCDILLPAPANLHSHGFQRAMAGLAEYRTDSAADSFWTWRDLMYRFLQRLSPDDVQAITAFAQMEMLESGFASVGEFHYLHHQPDGTPYANLAELSARVAAAAGDTGIGLTMLPVLYERGGCDGRPLAGGQLRFGNDLNRFGRLLADAAVALKGLDADAQIGVAPHSLRAVTPESLAAVATLVPGTPLHMHVAEQIPEIEEVIAATGARPLQWLFDNADIDRRWCLIHCTHADDREGAALARSGAIAGLCPETEASLGDGIFPAETHFARDGRFGIGTDSNIRISVAGELRMLEYGQRLTSHSRAVLADPPHSVGRALFERAARDGAAAIGRNAGTLAPGRHADILALNGSHPDLLGRRDDAWLDAFVFCGNCGMVADVWSAGRHRVTRGRHARRDVLTGDYVRTIRNLLEVL